jgi:hypothetical protein
MRRTLLALTLIILVTLVLWWIDSRSVPTSATVAGPIIDPDGAPAPASDGYALGPTADPNGAPIAGGLAIDPDGYALGPDWDPNGNA